MPAFAKKRILILGATGSIGQSCLDVVRRHRNRFEIVGLTTNRRAEKLAEAVKEFRPQVAVVASEEAAAQWGRRLRALGTEVLTGENSLAEVVRWPGVDLVVNGLVGAVGLLPTYQAVKAGRNVALANKESLVVGGELIMPLVQQKRIQLLPVDSEHSAIFQCLLGEAERSVQKIWLTGSGGPFRTWPIERLREATVQEALAHPNWVMGPKITVDSATMMNKGLEVIEAHWLFGLPVEKIEVIVHPQSIIHSMVEFVDGSVKAQLGVPDMRLPIQFALTFPERLPSEVSRVDFTSCGRLDFEEPDEKRFPALRLAYRAAGMGGTAPAALNAANEVAVRAFLDSRIRLPAIADVIGEVLAEHKSTAPKTVEDLLDVDGWARARAEEFVRRWMEAK